MKAGDRLDAAAVVEGFRLVLRRPPEDESVVAHYLSLGLTVRGFLDVLIGSAEFRDGQRQAVALGDLVETDDVPALGQRGRRVLLFGAFGNGNVGDMAQAAAVAALLRGFAAPAPLVVAATSWERRAPVPGPDIVRLRPDALLRPEHVRPRRTPDDGGTDLVVIGGGGLLGTPHFPLHERRWAEWFVDRGVPFALLGIGGSAGALAIPEWRDAYRLLLRHAVFVGLRDEETLEAARQIRPDAAWFPDPILLQGLQVAARADARTRPLGAVLIPRRPNGDADRVALEGLLRMAATESGVVVAALEPWADAPVLRGLDVRMLGSWDDLLALCAQARVVVSARLHGVVAGLACGCVVHGLAQPKTGDLMRRLGIGNWYHARGWPDPPPDLSPAATPSFRAALDARLPAFRAACAAASAAAAAALTPYLRAH